MRDISKVKNKIKGGIGETLACNFLEAKGYKIVEQNYKNKIGEIDIIASKGDLIVFVEVKARETCTFGRPVEAVTPYKQNQIRKVATFYLMTKKKTNENVRFDVIEILGDQINHFENAF